MVNLYTHSLSTTKAQCFVDITPFIKEDLKASGVQEGIVVIYCPHTTGGITINENADPDVKEDLLYGFEKVYPTKDLHYAHFEGNSHAHLKASTLGASETLIIHKGKLILGTWQSVYFGEFDGPRHRNFYVKIIPDFA